MVCGSPFGTVSTGPVVLAGRALRVEIRQVLRGDGERIRQRWIGVVGPDEHLAWARRYQAHTHLLEIYEKLGIPYLDLIEEFTVDNSREQIFNDFYVQRSESGGGHFTPKGNLLVAQLIKEKLENLQ